MIAAAKEHINWRLVLVAWVLAVLFLAFAVATSPVPPFIDNDDAMRMVTATDLANGQPWQDIVEHRDNVPFGTPMHWSRLVDAPIALIMLALRPFLGAAPAGDVTALFWPPLMLLGLLPLSILLTRRLLGPGHQLPAVLVPAFSLVILAEFSPGRIDHHNVQTLLTTALMLATIAGRTSWRWALGAGLLAATSLAIGTETLPFLAAAILAYSLFWVGDVATAPSARAFALAFAGGTLGHFLLATPPSRYFVAACDALSPVYVVAIGLTGAAIIAATLLGGRRRPSHRLLLIAVLGILAAALTLVIFPECRGGPYASLDARAYQLLIADVAEAQPPWIAWAGKPAVLISSLLPSLIGIPILLWAALDARDGKRFDWLALLIFLALASAVMLMQVRGARLAIMPAVPAGAWLIARARARYEARAGVPAAIGLVASWLLFIGLAQFALPTAATSLLARFSGTGQAHAATPAKPPPGSDLVHFPSLYARLAALPPGVVMTPWALGPEILRRTPHTIVAAGFHRNVEGALAVDDFLNAGEEAAKAIVRQRHVAYVVNCDGLRQTHPNATSKPDSFVEMEAQHSHWSWLVPVSTPDERLRIYRVALSP